MSHTPGPWTVQFHNGLADVLADTPTKTLIRDLSLADARLIAAAPDMARRIVELEKANDEATLRHMTDRDRIAALLAALESVALAGDDVAEMAPDFISTQDVGSLTRYGQNIASIARAAAAAHQGEDDPIHEALNRASPDQGKGT